MAQKLMATPRSSVSKSPENVKEPWTIYDTVLVGSYVSSLQQNVGYFTTFALMGAATNIPFFNVRNRNHGLAYNNQDTRDQLPYVFHLYTIGISFFSPSTACYRNNAGAPLGAQTTELSLFETELPKHTNVTLTTNQDDRLKTTSLQCPPGYGIISGGIAQGDPETDLTYPNLAKASWCQGTPELTNKWGFRNPLQIPRRANLTVNLGFSEYGRQLLQAMPGPHFQFFRAVADDGTYSFHGGMCGIQVTLGGVREVQQRGQYHA
jgi:hypothetical protein